MKTLKIYHDIHFFKKENLVIFKERIFKMGIISELIFHIQTNLVLREIYYIILTVFIILWT